MSEQFEDGFYWARIFGNNNLIEVVRRESGMWWACGNESALPHEDIDVIERVAPPGEKR